MNFNLTKTLGYNSQRFLKVIMRAFIFLFCTIAFSFNSNKGFTQNADINIDTDKVVSVEEIFNLIKEQAKYQFIYDVDMLKTAPVVSVKKGIIKAGRLLERGLSPINCTFEFSNNTIVVKKKPKKNKKQEEFFIEGIVTDKDGVAIPDISVYVSSRNVNENTPPERGFMVRGTATDLDGKFKIKATLNHYLIVDGLGYKIKSQKIATKQEYYHVTLDEEVNILNDVVVVGYDGNKQAYDAIKSGELFATALNNPFLMGEKAVEVGVEYLHGKRNFPRINPISAGVIVKDNVADYYSKGF